MYNNFRGLVSFRRNQHKIKSDQVHYVFRDTACTDIIKTSKETALSKFQTIFLKTTGAKCKCRIKYFGLFKFVHKIWPKQKRRNRGRRQLRLYFHSERTCSNSARQRTKRAVNGRRLLLP